MAFMDVTLQIPDEFAQRLKAAGGDLSRRALEALALDEYRLGHLSTGELRRLLGFATRAALDGFLKAHGVSLDYTLEDLEQDRRDLNRIGF
jgi:predicted HTH domain antitoxin